MPCFPGAEKKTAATVEPKKKKQRGWSTQPPFHSTLHTKGGKSMRINIDVPGREEQCPLTMSAMSEDCLDFLPGETYVASMPEARRITLPCGHGFGAMSITYHFARRDMRCPCCRAGHKQKMSAGSIPFHFRAKLVAHVEAAEQEDADEQARDDERVARDLDSRNMVAGLAVIYVDAVQDFLESSPVKMTVFMYNDDIAETPSMWMLFNMTLMPQPLSATTRDVTYKLNDDHRRELSRLIEDGTHRRMSFVAHSRDISNTRVVELARTDIVPMRETSNNSGLCRTIRAGATSDFEILRLGEPFAGIQGVLFHTRMENLMNSVM